MVKKAHIFFAALIGVAILVAASLSSAQVGENIQSVKVIGNKRIDESTILYYIKSKPGTLLSKRQIREDIEQIYKYPRESGSVCHRHRGFTEQDLPSTQCVRQLHPTGIHGERSTPILQRDSVFGSR